MASPQYYGDFGCLNFPKTGAQIREKAELLRSRINEKIKEREVRIRASATEMGLRDAGDVLMQLQSIAEGSSNAGNLNMTVGLAANMKSEIAEMNKEKQAVEKLRLIIENLPPEGTFNLDFATLTYFEW